MNRVQRRSADKVKHRIKVAPTPEVGNENAHFLLGLLCLLRSPIQSLKAIGLLAEMRDKAR